VGGERWGNRPAKLLLRSGEGIRRPFIESRRAAGWAKGLVAGAHELSLKGRRMPFDTWQGFIR
jgi:hypothetical protein